MLGFFFFHWASSDKEVLVYLIYTNYYIIYS